MHLRISWDFWIGPMRDLLMPFKVNNNWLFKNPVSSKEMWKCIVINFHLQVKVETFFSHNLTKIKTNQKLDVAANKYQTGSLNPSRHQQFVYQINTYQSFSVFVNFECVANIFLVNWWKFFHALSLNKVQVILLSSLYSCFNKILPIFVWTKTKKYQLLK